MLFYYPMGSNSSAMTDVTSMLFELEVTPKCTVWDTRMALAELLGGVVFCVYLVHNKQELQDEKRLEDYGITVDTRVGFYCMIQDSITDEQLEEEMKALSVIDLSGS